MSLFLSPDEALIYGLILGRRSDNPVPLSELCERSGMSARAVKGCVELLRAEHRLPIGARRGRPHGYYIAATVADLEASAKPMIAQAKRMLQGAYYLLGKKRVRELLGQGTL